jgi:hypothetical protein
VVNGSLGWTEAVLHNEPQARLARHLLLQRDLCSAKGLHYLLQHTMNLLGAPASAVRCKVVKVRRRVMMIQAVEHRTCMRLDADALYSAAVSTTVLKLVVLRRRPCFASAACRAWPA